MGIHVRRRAEARWTGSVPAGTGHIRTASGALDSDYSLYSREADSAGLNTNPESSSGPASRVLRDVGREPARGGGYAEVEVNAKAVVQMEQLHIGFRITEIALSVTGSAATLTQEDFASLADQAKRTCPVSLALAGTTITLAQTTVVSR